MSKHPPIITVHHTLTAPGTHVFVVRSPHVMLTIDLAAPGTGAEIYGIYRGSSADTFTLHITQRHSAPHTKSTCHIRTVLRGGATLTATNLIHIAQGANNTDTTTDLRTLLLSTHARATVTPQMEVIPSDVRCTHAATATPVDSTQRAYLHARGINDKKAVTLLATAFTADIDAIIARSTHNNVTVI